MDSVGYHVTVLRDQIYSQILFGLKRQDTESTSFKRPFINNLKYLQLMN